MDSQNVDAVWEMISGNLGLEENRATSTPNGDIQRKNRKSWFEKRKDSKFEIAIEKKTRRRSGKRKSEEEVETLLLTHFTNPPKIEFGKSKIGLKKSRTLRIKNPHEYPQTVKVERFPFKKNFSIDCDEVVVDAESTVLVTVEWCPENDGSFREMILFIVDNAYRLQAFVIGRCETPAEKKKSKGGLLGRRVKRPFSVVQTSNFANIAKSYSPQKETKKRKSVNRLIQAQDVSEGHTKEARISDGFIPPMVIPLEPDEQDENKNLGTENENSGKSGHRRSSTYRVPYIDVSPIKTVPDITPMKHEKKLVTVNTDDVPQKTTNSTECMPKTPSSTLCPVTTRTFVSPNSFLHDSLLSCKGTETQPAHSTVLPTPERCLVKEQPRSFVSPNSFLKDLNTTKEKLDAKCENEIPSPSTVLNESVPHEIIVQQLAFVKKNLTEKGEEYLKENKIGKESQGQQAQGTTNTEENVLPNRGTFMGRNSVSEDPRRGTFTVGGTTQHSSSKRGLFINDSTVISKSETVTRHSIQYTVSESEETVCHGTFVLQGSKNGTVPIQEMFTAKDDVRRETFAVRDPKMITEQRNLKSLDKSHTGIVNPFSIIPEGTSPRRTTFTIKGRSSHNKASVRKLSTSESSKIHSKWKRRSQESNLQIKVSDEVDTPMKSLRNQDGDHLDMNNSASEDRILYFDKAEVTERLCNDALPTPERLVSASIKTPSKNTNNNCASTSKDCVPGTAPQASHISINEKFSSLATPERALVVNHSPLGRKIESCVHHISPVQEVEEQDSLLVKAYIHEEEECHHLSGEGKNTVKSEEKTETVIHEHSPCRDQTKMLTLSGSETVTKLKPDTVSINSSPTSDRNTSNSDSKNLSGSLTVIKEKPEIIGKSNPSSLVLPTPEHNFEAPNQRYEKVSNSKQLFSPGNLSSSFGSPKRLPDSPLLNDITNRTSLTVTKERPSDALMEFTQKQVKTCLFDVDQEEVSNNIKEMCPPRDNFCETIPEEVEENVNANTVNAHTVYTEQTNNCDGNKNNTHDMSENKSFPTTPHQLPSSPNPDLSRRSTHVVEHPKVLDLSQMDRRRLFSPLITEDCKGVDLNEKDHKTDTCIAVSQEPICTVQESCNNKAVMSSHPFVGFIPLKAETDGASESVVKGAKQVKPSKQETSNTRSFNQPPSRVKKDVKPVQGKQNRTNSTRPLSRKDTVVKSSNIQTNVKDARASKHSTQSEKASKPAASGVQRSKFSLPQSKLVLTKKSKTALPKHPMPFASKNMYYDERWMEKQERGFTHWLNFLLTPTEEYQLSYNKTKIDAGKLFMETPSSKALLAPTKEVLSFRAYAATRRLNQLRRSACKLFQSDGVVHVIQKIEAEIDSQRLLIRKDRMVHADLGLKQGILDMLLSFNPLWLRIGLETIYGEIIPIQRNDDVYGLSRFIVTRLLGSPDIAQEYAHPTVPHLYKDGYAAAIARHTLKKFLLLVYFLDHAKTKHLINHDPCLFCKDSEYKNCKAMLVEFSRCYLAGEGDVTRHLGYLGYIVTHTQVPLDEFEYAVNNIATDLRDGVRLTKVVELLSSKMGLTKKLRAPAISRLQKVHNMEVVFNVLKEHGIDFTKHTSPIMPRDIVDGHRERTLRFLWTLILQYQVSVLLSEEQLKEEIEILQKSLKVRNQLSALQRYEQGLKEKRRESAEPELHTKNKILGLVLKWCRVVCAFYDIKIENFTVSFGDGRALCYLVHHYHPSLLPREAIKTRTMMSYHTESEQNNIGDSSLSESPEPFIVNEDPKLYEELLANEKENFKLLYEKVSELGSIPMMVRSIDMSNTIPDEKVVVTYVTYLCARLLDIRHESRAARIIQLAWRRYVLRKSQRELEIKVKAAIVLQRAFRSYHARMVEVRRSSAAVTIQSYWRRTQAIRRLRQLQWERDHHTQVMAANVIKHHLRGWCKMRQYQRLVRSTVLIQSLGRRYLTLKNLRKHHQAATAIQTYYLGYKLTRQTRKEFIETRQAVCTIQRWYRDRLTERQAAREKAAVMVQAWWRMVVCRKAFIKRRTCTIVIQKHVRGYICRKCFQRKKRATCYIQQKIRGIMKMRRDRRDYMKLYKSCLLIQRKWRIIHQQKKALMIQSATRIQSWYRGCVTRKQYQQSRRAAIKIQGSIRGYLIRKQYTALQKATVLVQQRYRAVRKMREVMSEYRDLRRGTVIAQSLWRRKMCRDSFIKQRKAAIIIQSYCRGQQQRKIYKEVMSQCNKAALTIQTFYKGMKQRKVFLIQKQAAVIIQKRCRGYLARRRYKEMKQAATVLQIKWRERAKVQRARNTFLTQKRAVLVLQSHVRKFLVMRQYRRLKRSAIYIQSLIRMKKVKKEYQAKRNAAVILQSRFRAVREGKKRRWEFLIKKGAAITIQMFYRAFKVRQSSSAIRIQANVRRFLAQTKFKKLKTAAITCQRLFRAKREVENCVECYRKVQDSVKSIQSWWRGVRCRRKYVQMKSAAILLQSRFRGIKQLRMYQMQKSSVIVLQRHVRALFASERERRRYLKLRAACVRIQARWRGTTQRRKYRGIVNNVIKAQSYVRRFLEQNRYQKLRKATVTIQQRYRGHLAKTECQTKYLLMKKSAILIQRCYRHHLQRTQMKLNSAATRIQSAYKGYCVRKSFVLQRKSAIVIQKYTRTFLARKQYCQKKNSATIIQRNWKAFITRRKFLIMKGAAITLQCHIKSHLSQNHYRRLKKATLCVQSIVKMRNKRREFLNVKSSVRVLQDRTRAFLQGQRVRRQILIQHGAAITIQSCYRGYTAKKQYKCMKKSAVLIQSMVRMHQARRAYTHLKQAAVVLQTRYRAHLQGQRQQREYQRKRSAVVTIQVHYRRHLCRKHFVHLRQSSVKLQAAYRMYLCRKHFLKKRAAAVMIQNKFRATILAQQTQRHFLVMKGAAISVQAWYKGCMQRAHYRNTLVHVRRLQAIIRGYLVRKQNRELQKAVCFVQIKYREKKLTDKLRAEFLEKKGAAVTIQAWYRGHVQRMKYKHHLTCVCKVQSVVRGHLERKHLQELRRAVCLVQRRYRERKLTDQLRTEFLERKGAVMTIQAWYRGHIQRVKYQHYLTCVHKIQSTIRGYLVRKQLQDLRRAACVVQKRYKEKRLTQSLRRDFLQKRMSAVCIQRAYRVMVQKKKEILAQRRAVFLSKFVSLVQYNLSAFQIQRAYRKYRTLCAAKKKMKSILCIQHWMRAKLVRLRYLRFQRSLNEVQRLCKMHLRRREDSARIIQAYFRRWQTRQQEQRKIHAAVTLQAVWRGRHIRIKSKSRKLANIRQRIEEANRSATEEKKLCNRTASALDYLLKYKHLSQILDALMHLDVATRLSSHCCVRMVEVNAVQVIYTLIQSCNRSQPHMEIINYSVSILLNLAKYDKTVGAVYIPGSVDVLLELLQIYREKGVIFYRTCTLLGILGIDLDRRMTIGSDPKFKDKIQSLHVLVSRKNKVNETRQLRQARQLAAKSFNCTLPVHVPVKKVHKIRPDWVLQRDKMHEIDNPMQAINFVMDNYNITPKK